MATALQVQALLRRGAAAAPPPLAVLRPLFPGGRYSTSTPRSPLPAAAATAVGLPYVRRRPQLSPPAPVPPLLRYFSSKRSKGCAPLPRRRPQTSTKGTPPRLEQGCAPLPRGQPPTSSKGTPWLEQGEELMIGLLGDLKNVKKQDDILDEALDNCSKAAASLSGTWNDKNVAMLENGLEKAFKALAVTGGPRARQAWAPARAQTLAYARVSIAASCAASFKTQFDGRPMICPGSIKLLGPPLLAVYEKSLDDLSGALGSSNAFFLKASSSNALSKDVLAFAKDTLQQVQMFHKKSIDASKGIRQELNALALFMTLKKFSGMGLSTSVLILTAVACRMFLGLLVMIIVKFLA